MPANTDALSISKTNDSPPHRQHMQSDAPQHRIVLATASNFKGALIELVSAYQHRIENTEINALRIDIVSNSTGAIYHQVIHGAPFDIFFAADTVRPRRLVDNKHIKPAQYFEYAVGELILAIKPDIAEKLNLTHCDQVSPDEFLHRFLRLLSAPTKKTEQRQEGVQLIMANPRTAPYGRAAKQLIDHLAIANTDNSHITVIHAKNVLHAQQLFAKTNASVAILAKSQQRLFDRAQSNNQEQRSLACDIPSHLYTPIIQAGAILASHTHSEKSYHAAIHFIQFLSSDTAQKILASYGYHSPHKTIVSPKSSDQTLH